MTTDPIKALAERLQRTTERMADVVMVPREPTEAMMWAGQNVCLGNIRLAETYRAMLAAAPPASPAPVDDGELVERIRATPPREICEHGSQKVKCAICENAALEARITELERQLAEAKEALKPFADEAANHEEVRDEMEPCTYIIEPDITVGDLRRAARALSGKGET